MPAVLADVLVWGGESAPGQKGPLTAMQIRLTVIDPLGPAPQRGRPASRDVLVTAPVGTDLAAVASALATAVTGEGGGGREASGAPVVLYAGAERLDARRRTLGEPPLVDGAVLSLGAPAAPEPHPELDDAPTQLHVVAGPDAGGVHLLHGGRITVGRSADADVPLDDPDVSRLHCAVTVAADGAVSVTDLGSTNGTTLDGTRVTDRPQRFPAGALLRLGESALRVTPSGGPGARVRTVPDGEGCVRFPLGGGGAEDTGTPGASAGFGGDAAPGAGISPGTSATAGTAESAGADVGHARVEHPATTGPSGPTPHAYGTATYGASGAGAQEHGYGEHPSVPGQAGAPSIESRDGGGPEGGTPGLGAGTPGQAAGTPGPGARTAAPDWGAGAAGPGAGAAGPGAGTPGQAAGTAGPGAGTPGQAAGTAGPGAGTASVGWAMGHSGIGELGSEHRSAGASAGAPGAAASSGHGYTGAGRLGADGPGDGPRATGASGPLAAPGGHAGAGRFGAGEPDNGLQGTGASHSVPASSGQAGAGGFGAGEPGGDLRAPRTPGPASGSGDTHAGRHGIGGPGGLTDGPYAGTTAPSMPHDNGSHPGGSTTSSSPTGLTQGTYAGPTPSGPAPHDSGSHPGGSTASSSPTGLAQGTYTGPTPSGPAPHANGSHPGGNTSSGGRKGTPVRGTDVPQGARRRGGLGAWARRLAGGRGEQAAAEQEAYGAGPATGTSGTPTGAAPQQPDTWPDPAALLLTALGPGPRLWERGPGHPEALVVRLGTADRAAPDSTGLLPAVPVTAALREAGALGLAGPRPRLSGLARAVLAQLAALHSPDLLEIVLISADRSRPVEERTAEWSWLGWLPHVRPGHGQDCRLLLAYDREQAAARTEELLRRVEDHAAAGRSAARPATARTAPTPTGPVDPAGRAPGVTAHATPVPTSTPTPTALPGTTHPNATPAQGNPTRRPSWARDDAGPDGVGGFAGPYTVVIVDGDPGGAALREAVARLAVAGPRAGIHVVCLAETPAASPSSPVTETYEAACAVTPTFRHCGAVALLGGDVASVLHLMRVARGGPVGPGVLAAVDAVSPAWAERFARALAPLRPDGPVGERHAHVAVPLPQSARLLDELGLARATPASLMARWADAADDTESLGGRARAVLGAGPRGPLTADLVTEGPHLLIEGPAGSGRTELLRAVVASLAAAERPDRLGMVLIDGRDGVGTAAGRGEGLRVCTDIPHVTTHLIANDPVRMREFAQSLSAELKRRAELLGMTDFAQWHTGREVSGRIVAQRTPGGRPAAPGSGAGDIDAPPSSTLRLRPGAAARQRTEAAPPLPRLVVVVDDLDALVSPALGSPGRPAAGSVMRALEAVAREGERLGVHLVAAAGTGGRTAETEPARRATLRVTLDAPSSGPDDPAPGRGRLTHPDGRSTAFQGGRVTGRIPRTATQRPTVLPLEWQRMGDPPARRPVRELGNGPTDLALLASAVQRAAREVSAAEVPSLL